ncbi:MAG: signal transduction histidine kinase [Candidatus Omnitrophota bacterium]
MKPLSKSFVVLAIYIACITPLYVIANNISNKAVNQEFEITSKYFINRFEAHLNDYFDVLRSVKGLYDSSEHVNRQEFHTFAQFTLERHPGIQALEWLPKVPYGEIDDFVLLAQKDGFGDFEITELSAQDRMVSAAKRDVYFPVYYVEPYEGNQGALGFDLYSNNERQVALDKSRDSGALVVTSPITLVQDEEKSKAVLAILPVYAKAASPQAKPSKAELISGYVLGVFRFVDIVEKAFELSVFSSDDLKLEIFDLNSSGRTTLAYSNKPSGNRLNTVLSHSTVLDIGQRQWKVHIEPSTARIAMHSLLDMRWVLFVGFILASLISLLFNNIANRNSEIEKHVDEKTQELVASKDILELEMAKAKTYAHDLSEQKEKLLKQQEATLNILEDVQNAKQELGLAYTLIKSKTDELEKSHAVIEKVNLELDSFVYTASHDLKAPLRGIGAFASYLEEDYGSQLDDKGKDHLQRIRKAANRMSQLIEDLLTLSRISRQSNPYTQFSVHELIESVSERIEYDLQENKVELWVDPNIPNIIGDEIKLAEVFLNLINNGIKFSSKNKTAKPLIEVGYKDGEGLHEFFVKDNGIGIDPKYHEQCFKIFKRLHTASEYEGSGAGLSIVKRIVNDHNGHIWIESELNHGAKFCFTIPKDLNIK